MRVSQDEKDRSHDRIVRSAARLLRGRGIDGASIADVMSDAGLTHGGFYRHFDSKEELLAAALASAFDDIDAAFGAQVDEAGAGEAADMFQALYLSDEHVTSIDSGCPAAALGGDVGRGPESLKAPFGAGVGQMIASLAKGMPGPEAQARRRAARRFAMMAGALMIARASDPATARELLLACRGASGEVD